MFLKNYNKAEKNIIYNIKFVVKVVRLEYISVKLSNLNKPMQERHAL